MIEIKNATQNDFQATIAIFDKARELMTKRGNLQWADGWPFPEFVAEWIQKGELFIVLNGKKISAVFAISFCNSEYDNANINWLNNEPYICIRCFALLNIEDLGLIKIIISWCLKKSKNIRVDTGVKNFATQYMLKKNGFVQVGKFLPTYPGATEMFAFHLVEEGI